MGLSIAKGVKVTRVMNAVAAGQTAQNSSSVDRLGFETVVFVATFGAITAGAATSVKVQTSSDDSSFNDLLGSSVTVADDDDNKAVWVEIVRPRERYLRMTISRATQDSVIDGIIAIQGLPKVRPTTHDSTTVLGGESHVSPAEGTA